MRIHIAGICGTFMGGLAILARQLGYEVSGSDTNIYPPMSDQLAALNIALFDGYDPANIRQIPDLVVIGNALSRGNPLVEDVLNRGLPYTSGPAFLAERILQHRWVLAVAGTHGKTTTTAMLTWILEYAGFAPGFLVGGIPQNFNVSARLGEAPFFVVEADEYDSAFFDKRSKFIHYRPRTLVLNNLEFDHADIFPNLDAIKRQFHHLVRTVPGNGQIILPIGDTALRDVISQGCWTPLVHFSDDPAVRDGNLWNCRNGSPSGEEFDIYHGNQPVGCVKWSFIGQHNIHNALAAVAAAQHAGVPPQHAVQALSEFQGVRRRMEKRATIDGVTIYDDFAHHPTAIATTLAGLRRKVGSARIIAIMEPRSNTMRLGVHKESLAPSLAQADEAIFFQPSDLKWQVRDFIHGMGTKGRVFENIDDIVQHVKSVVHSGDHIIVMSNGDFGGLHNKLIEILREQ
jgi:UDP-N-acetylmuramate: L-alanyl-gamma-D-glutamyl-meso-diaminopimelate ligase